MNRFVKNMKLLKFLEQNNLTMAQFAKSIGCSRQSVWNYCQTLNDNNQQIPRPNTINKIHKFTKGKVTILDFYTKNL